MSEKASGPEVKVIAMELTISFLVYDDKGKVKETSNGKLVVLESAFDKTLTQIAHEAKIDFVKQQKSQRPDKG